METDAAGVGPANPRQRIAKYRFAGLATCPTRPFVAYKLQGRKSMGSYMSKVEVAKEKFDMLLSKVLRAKPAPRDKIKNGGKHGPKTPILAKP